VTSEGGLFIQDKWTMNRLTLSMGVRYDWFNSENPSFHLGPSILTPNRNYDVPAFSTTRYKDITPKVAAAYDLFGDGKTAIKVNVGRYVLGQALVLGGLASQPGYNVQLTSSRTWTDNNHNFIPDCDLTRNTSQGPTQTGADKQIDTCLPAAGANALFYSNSLNPNLAVQDDARYGWGKRPYSWEFSVSAQREIGRGVSVNGGVFRRWFGNFIVTDDTNHLASDYTAYSIPISSIPPPPASAGGQALPPTTNASGFYNVNDTRPATNLQGLSDTMFPGSNVIDHWFGFDLGLNARLPHGIIFQGGLSTGHQTTDYCDVEDPAKAGPKALVEMLAVGIPAVNTSLNTCHMDQNWLPQVKFLGSYTMPKVDVQIGASYQSIPGIEYAATYAAPNTVVAQSLGRLPTNGTPTGTTALGLVQPGSFYGTRFNQLDVRFGKILRFGHTRSNLSLDVFNMFNSDVVSGASASYTTWLAPSAVVAPRLLKVSWTFDF
jgi:hypothetical protein